MSGNLYAERDVLALREHYCRHVDAMTREGLHDKSDIAAELAWSYSEIERLTQLVERAGEPVAWMPIETAPRDGTYILVTNEEAGGAWVAKWEPVYASGYMPRNPWSSMMLNTWHLPNRHASSTPTRWQPLPPTTPGASHER